MLIKIAIGVVTSKLLAVFVGPSGMALVGNLKNFITSLESIATLGFQNGIIKYVAENDKNKTELNKIISSVFISLLFFSVLISLILFVFCSLFNHQIFGRNTNYLIVIQAIALGIPFYSMSIFFLSVINGLGKYRKVIIVNILGNIIGLILSIIFIYKLQTLGALLSIVVAPSLLFFVTYYLINSELDILKNIKLSNFDFKIIKNLAAFSLMALVSAVLGPIVYLAIRKNIIADLGINQAGYWETITRISGYYMMFINSILVIYFLPKLIKAKNNMETKAIFHSYYKYILPVFIIGTLGIYFFRFPLIKILFTNDFLPVVSLFFWQIIGDILKVTSLVLGYNFFAKRLTKAFILSEILSLLSLYLLSIYLIKIFDLQGIIIAQAIDNFLYLIILMFYFRKSLF